MIDFFLQEVTMTRIELGFIGSISYICGTLFVKGLSILWDKIEENK